MNSEANKNVSPSLARELIDPANVVAAMASAVEHVRQLAMTVFKGDAALFDGPPQAATSAALHDRARRPTVDVE